MYLISAICCKNGCELENTSSCESAAAQQTDCALCMQMPAENCRFTLCSWEKNQGYHNICQSSVSQLPPHKHTHTHVRPLEYLFGSAQFLDAFGIMSVLFKRGGTGLSQKSLQLLFDTTFALQLHIKKNHIL